MIKNVKSTNLLKVVIVEKKIQNTSAFDIPIWLLNTYTFQSFVLLIV